jgi:hypothetical protein
MRERAAAGQPYLHGHSAAAISQVIRIAGKEIRDRLKCAGRGGSVRASKMVGSRRQPMTAEDVNERLAKAEMRAARLHTAVVKAIDDLCILVSTFRIDAQTHDEEYVRNVKARHVRAAMKVAKNLANAIAEQKSQEYQE